MKIAVWHNLPSGGGKRALHSHVRGLVERGHTVEAWCPPTADQTYLPLGGLITEHVLPLSWEERTPKSRLGNPAAYYHNIVSKIEAVDEHCRRCADEINGGGFDLLFAGSCLLSRVAPVGRHVNLPKVIYLQEPYRYLYEAADQLPWIAMPRGESNWSPKGVVKFLRDLVRVQGLRILAREELQNARAFDAILVNSYFSRESILRAYGLDAKVCYLGIDTETFADLGRARENFVIGVGAFVPQKNIRLVLEALGRLRGTRPRLVWVGNVGEPSYLEELKRHARSLGVDFEPRVRVTDAELVELLGRARMMVYAPRLEPFGFVPLEANACGLPVVGVMEGGLRETVVDGVNGLLAESDARSLAGAIERLIADEAYARRLGEGGRRLVAERWSLGASIDRLEERFAEILDASRAAASGAAAGLSEAPRAGGKAAS
jgi:glycosyltransferase involved in cell wall biosynthesis